MLDTLDVAPPPAEETRGPKPRAILDAAGELFLAQGFVAVSMDPQLAAVVETAS